MIEINVGEVSSKEDMANNLRIIAEMIDHGYTAGCDPYWSITGDEEKDEEEEVECSKCGELCPESDIENINGESLCPTCYDEMLFNSD